MGLKKNSADPPPAPQITSKPRLSRRPPGYKPGCDKIMRLHAQTANDRKWLVRIPETAPWLAEYLHEISVSPRGKHDDQVDSTAQFLDSFKTPRPGWSIFEYTRQRAEELEQRRNATRQNHLGYWLDGIDSKGSACRSVRQVCRVPASDTACESTRRSKRGRSAKPGSYARAESRQNLQHGVNQLTLGFAGVGLSSCHHRVGVPP
jgi:hypothetical protein